MRELALKYQAPWNQFILTGYVVNPEQGAVLSQQSDQIHINSKIPHLHGFVGMLSAANEDLRFAQLSIPAAVIIVRRAIPRHASHSIFSQAGSPSKVPQAISLLALKANATRLMWPMLQS